VAINILVIDDHPLFRRGLKSLIDNESDLHVCAECASAEDALSFLRRSGVDIDIATVDLSLSGTSGLQLIKNIRAHNKSIKILVASMHDEQMFAERCLRAGANGYINKEEAPQKIVKAIHAIWSGKYYLSDAMLSSLAQRNLDGASNTTKTSIELLSDRELEIFMLIAEGKNSQKIADLLNISSKTVDTHKEHIKKKLGIHDKAELIKHAVSWSISEMLV
jgi:DNA-binding NarL/FixJ family response regulator